jgi:hypothetical protein
MKAIIGIVLVATCLYLLKLFIRKSSTATLLDAGATKMPLFPELKAQEPLGLAAISPARYENRVRALLKGDGLFVAFRDEEDAYYLPLSLISLTGKSWLQNPLVFGRGERQVELDFGDEITGNLKRMKAQTNIQPGNISPTHSPLDQGADGN